MSTKVESFTSVSVHGALRWLRSCWIHCNSA